MPHNERPLVLVNEIDAAQRLALSIKTLRRWRWAGKGPPFLKIGGAVRYDPSDLTEFVEASRRHSTSDGPAGTSNRRQYEYVR
jgi:hypothetical protein